MISFCLVVKCDHISSPNNKINYLHLFLNKQISSPIVELFLTSMDDLSAIFLYENRCFSSSLKRKKSIC